MKYMTVKKLRKLLKKQPGDMIVMLARDPEGNGFSPMDKRYPISFGTYHYGEGYLDELEGGHGEGAVTLWPSY